MIKTFKYVGITFICVLFFPIHAGIPRLTTLHILYTFKRFYTFYHIPPLFRKPAIRPCYVSCHLGNVFFIATILFGEVYKILNSLIFTVIHANTTSSLIQTLFHTLCAKFCQSV
jgi:hypothetical protein